MRLRGAGQDQRLDSSNENGTINNNAGGTIELNRQLVLGIARDGTYNLNAGGTLNANALLTNQAGHVQANAGTINNQSIFTNDGTLQNDGTLNNDSRVNNNGTLDNAGTLDNRSNITNHGALNNTGAIDSNRLINWGTVSNLGTLTNNNVVNNHGTVENDGTLNNFGTVRINASGEMTGQGIFTQTAGTLTVRGTVTQAAVNINGGVLEGTGTVSAAVIVNGGTVGPGTSPGLLQVFGDVDVNTGSTLAFELGGLLFGTEYDRLDVSDDTATTGAVEGTVSLAAGTIFDIDYFGAFTASAGDSFDVLVADDFAPFSLTSLIFDFSGAALASGLSWETSLIDFGGGREALRLTVALAATGEIPAPGVILLFGLGLAGIGFARRRHAA